MARTQIMYIEQKGGGVTGPGRIGRVRFSKSGRTIYYRGLELQSLQGGGFKANYLDVESGEHYWVSNCRKDGNDALYPATIEIDEDIAEEYWSEIRHMPHKAAATSFRSRGKHSAGGKEPKLKRSQKG